MLQAEATSLDCKEPANAAGAADAATSPQQQQQQQQRQMTHFAPQQLPPELAVAAVLAVPPSLAGAANGSNGSPAGGSAAGTSLARTAHFFGLAFSLFEELLGAHCPLPAMQQVRWPEVGAEQGWICAGSKALGCTGCKAAWLCRRHVCTLGCLDTVLQRFVS